jgi:hypothetical protein
VGFIEPVQQPHEFAGELIWDGNAGQGFHWRYLAAGLAPIFAKRPAGSRGN